MRPYYYLGDDRGLTQLSEGQPFYVYTKDRSITPWILLGGIWETFVDDVLCALIRPGDVFLDVGANQGYYTVKIGTKVGPQGWVYAFEPNPLMVRFLFDNIDVNGLSPRTSLVPYGAGAETSSAVMIAQDNYPGGAFINVAPIPGYEPPPPPPRPDKAGPIFHIPLPREDHNLSIDLIRIDEVVPAHVSADLVKLDVEGFEPLALQGMRELLARSPDCAIVCEVSIPLWRRIGDPVQILKDAAGDRRIFRIQHDGVLDELTEDLISALDPNFVSYVLLLPRSEMRYEQIRRFVRGEPAA